ncbi:hypothetical protein [Pseudonocardia pini]|uniref:hypothetical protein n=1 Tax=Pseudonocardia pini TaxID=2758030 RepID=UPI0015F0B420|nr:hypothetical protein [Pseudonocardia pini]
MSSSPRPSPSGRRRGRLTLLVVGLGLLALVGAGVVVNLGNGSSPFTAEPARTLTDREWALIAKDPDAHSGERVVVHGSVTQFDANLGDSRFVARVQGTPETGEHSSSVVVVGRSRELAAIVEGDEFRAEVTVAGAGSYSANGNGASVPELEIDALSLTQA